jgi:hypothetical protein
MTNERPREEEETLYPASLPVVRKGLPFSDVVYGSYAVFKKKIKFG